MRELGVNVARDVTYGSMPDDALHDRRLRELATEARRLGIDVIAPYGSELTASNTPNLLAYDGPDEFDAISADPGFYKIHPPIRHVPGYNPTGLPIALNVTAHFAPDAGAPDAGHGIYADIFRDPSIQIVTFDSYYWNRLSCRHPEGSLAGSMYWTAPVSVDT